MTDAALAELPFSVPPSDGPIIIAMPGLPQGKGRPRFVRRTGIAYTPPATRAYEGTLTWYGHMAMAGRPPINGPISVVVDAYFAVPQSWTFSKRKHALEGKVPHIVKPDADNLLKMLDALNGVVWDDDKQIAMCVICKRYDARPRLEIKVAKL